MLLQAESVTSCAAVRRMAVIDGSCSLPGINNRLLGFKYIMSASSAVMEKVQLGSLQSDWWLAACRVRSCARTVCAVLSSTSTLRAAWTITSIYGPVLVCRTAAVAMIRATDMSFLGV